MTKIHPVILSGGAGTRLWPLSRELYPKQLLALASERSLLQDTANRVGQSAGFAEPLVVCNDEHRFIIAEQLRQLGVRPRAIVLEPAARNTAPAVAAAAGLLRRDNPDAFPPVPPPDPVIPHQPAVRPAAERPRGAAP